MKPLTNTMTAVELARKVDGVLHGDAHLVVSRLCPIETPSEGGVTFVRAQSPSALLRKLKNLPKMVALVDATITQVDISTLICTVVTTKDPQKAFISLVSQFYSPYSSPKGIHATASIHPTATIEDGVAIGPGCVVGELCSVGRNVTLEANVVLYPGVTIGPDTRIYSGVAIREGCSLGANCIVHNNVVIGADGFGYLADPQAGISKVPQVGIVEIGDHVEIGACTTIDRGTVGSTVIGSHVKIDNQVQIGHNVKIESHTIICAQVGIAGSCLIKRGVVLGGGVGVADHVTIAAGSRIGGHAGVISSIDEPGDYMGFPAIKATEFRRQQVTLRRLAAGKSVKTGAR
jgi:UDP-3-O-[3-hydroxymyristoyl] glucosamine N-acyltransferase